MSQFQDIDGTLYFIALIPGGELRNRVLTVKERMKALYNAGHALKSPAHITLQMPFKRHSGDEPRMTEALRKFASEEKPFEVSLDGYGAFVPRVIYINIAEPGPVRELHTRLKAMLLSELGFTPSELMKDVQPHITVATRDLTKTAFSQAWPELRNEEFKAAFTAESIFLLKHNGKYWDIFREFNFR